MNLRHIICGLGVAAALASVLAPAWAGNFTVRATPKTGLKAVFAQVEARDTVDARARIGGTIVSLGVEEGSAAKAGDVLANVVDDKISLQLGALDAQIKGLHAQLDKANADLARGKTLFASGTIAKANLDTLQTAANVLVNQIAATEAQRSVLVQQAAEGQVLAPASGRVLTVPLTKGSVVMPGEAVAKIAVGGYFLRLSLPERHAALLHVGDAVQVGARGITATPDAGYGNVRQGRLVKVYPQIDSGHVLADVEVDGLGDYFVGERTLVWIPVADREVIAVPPDAVVLRYGIDYVRVAAGDQRVDVAVIPGEVFDTPEGPRLEILSGLNAGDVIDLP
jgi:RND family efflux transporter MFP subunit